MESVKSSVKTLLVRAREHPALATAAIAAISTAAAWLWFSRGKLESHGRNDAVEAVLSSVRSSQHEKAEDKSAVATLLAQVQIDNPLLKECCAEVSPIAPQLCFMTATGLTGLYSQSMQAAVLQKQLQVTFERLLRQCIFVRKGSSAVVLLAQGQPMSGADVSTHSTGSVSATLTGWTRYGRFSLLSQAMVPRRLRVASAVAPTTGYIYVQWYGRAGSDTQDASPAGVGSGAGAAPQDTSREDALGEVLRHVSCMHLGAAAPQAALTRALLCS